MIGLEMKKDAGYNLIIDTGTFLRLLMATPENAGTYSPGLLNIIEVMTEMGIACPVYCSEVITEIFNSHSIIDKEKLFEIDDNNKIVSIRPECFDRCRRLPKALTRLEHFKRIYNMGGQFITTDVANSYLNAIKYDSVVGGMTLNCGMLVIEATPELLNTELAKTRENAPIIEVVKNRGIRSDIGEIACGAIAANCQSEGVGAAILFQGNDVRSRVIYRGNNYDPFVTTQESNKHGRNIEKLVPHRFNPHRFGFEPQTTKPIANIGCLTTLGFLFPLITRAKKDAPNTYILHPQEADDTEWYQKHCPEESLRGHFSKFLIMSSNRIGGKALNEYDALKDLTFAQVGREIKHEHNHTNATISSPWYDYIFSLNKDIFIKMMENIRERLDQEKQANRSPEHYRRTSSAMSR